MGAGRLVVSDEAIHGSDWSDDQLDLIVGDYFAMLDAERTATPVVAFEVEDVEAARDELAAAGVELLGDIGRWNGFEWLYFRSADGHVLSLEKTPPPGWERSSGA